MEICNSCDIVHLERKCPLCKAIEEIEELKDKVQELEEENKDLVEKQN